MKKLIIFDLDGTLLNTLPDLTNSINYSAKQVGFCIQSEDDIRRKIGNGVQTLVARCLPNKFDDPKYQKALEVFIKHYNVHSNDSTEVYEDIISILNTLKTEGYKLAVCTNKVQNIAKDIIEKLIGNDIFSYIQGDEETINKKPAPDMINKVCEALSFDKQDVLYIGDTEVDEQTAINSNVDYFLITYGYRTLEELSSKCPNALLIMKENIIDTIHNFDKK